MDKWDLVYTKEYEAQELKAGDMDPEFNFKVNTDFHIVSRMSQHKYIDLISNKAVLKRPNSRKTQVWFFDKDTKTIKSRSSTSYSLQITGSGGNNQKHMHITTTNSRWW